VTDPAQVTATATLNEGVVRFLKQHPPFCQMEETSLQFLAAHVELGYYPKGAVILEPDQPPPKSFHIIQRGMVQLVPFNAAHSDDVHPVAMGPGECFSVSAMLENRPVIAPYTAVADTFCYELPAELFPELLNCSPIFREFTTEFLTSMLRESRRLIKLNFNANTGEQQTMSRTLRSLIVREPVTCKPETPIGEVLRVMQARKIGSILVVDGEGSALGIFTRHDVLDRVALAQCGLAQPVSEVMTPQPLTLPAEASAYEAALLIADRGIRHIPVCDNGRLLGVITERDLFALQRISLRAINRTIAGAQSIDDLRKSAADIRRLARNMLGQGVSAEHMTLIISTLNDTLVRQVLNIEESRFDLQGLRWSWLAFGSEGRYEQTISTDQDNGLIFDSGAEAPDTARTRLLPFAQAVNRALDACGFPLCKGNIMAGNPDWCLSAREWRERFDHWIANTDPQALLSAVIFFDFRSLYGTEDLAQSLRQHLVELAAANSRFQRQLAQYALQNSPPLGLISDFVTDDKGEERGTIDLKKSGARLFTDAARVLALAAGVAHTNTVQRLRKSAVTLQMPTGEVDAIVEGFYFMQTLRLRGQISADPAVNLPNRINPSTLNEVDRRILKESLRQLRKLQSRIALDYKL
jgi:CBS domain-containing protein